MGGPQAAGPSAADFTLRSPPLRAVLPNRGKDGRRARRHFCIAHSFDVTFRRIRRICAILVWELQRQRLWQHKILPFALIISDVQPSDPCQNLIERVLDIGPMVSGFGPGSAIGL